MYKFKSSIEYWKPDSMLFGLEFKEKFLTIGLGSAVIPAGYSWDGCSPKRVFGDLIFGTPDGKTIFTGTGHYPITYHASMVHDALYQYKKTVPVTRKQADQLFYRMLKEQSFKLAKVYYIAVRIFGGLYGKWGTR